MICVRLYKQTHNTLFETDALSNVRRVQTDILELNFQVGRCSFVKVFLSSGTIKPTQLL